MRSDLLSHQKILKACGLLVVTLYLHGCGSAPERPEASATLPASEITTPLKPVQLPPSEFSAQFNQAEQALQGFNWMAASNTLADIPAELPRKTDQQYRNYLQARIHYLRGDPQKASSLLMARESSLGPLDPAIRIKANNLQRYILSLSGKNLQSALLGKQMLNYTSSDDNTVSAMRRSIWSELQKVPAPDLQRALKEATEPRWQGWLSLSLLMSRQGLGPLDMQRKLSRWRDENPNHPGANPLPGGLEYLLNGPETLHNVALILPLSGRLAPAAKAVRDGYLSRYYATQPVGQAAPAELQILDRDRYRSIEQAYKEASAAGAQLIIGPLNKHDVANLGKIPDRQVPVLALNRVDETLPIDQMALIQLALAPEDEAEQIAQLAFGQGHRRAILIRPQGNWGNKMEQALLDRWTALGGTLAATARYSGRDDYSSSMADAMSLPASEDRAGDIRRMLDSKIEFTARRRQDIDAVFLLSRNSAEARSLKPLLAYHYAGNLPVYATSSIYRGTADIRDKDLNGVTLVETPWILSPESHQTQPSMMPGTDAYARLHALGADAYLLQSRFPQLQAGADVFIRGNTGLLSLDPHLRIKRQLLPATFDGGVIRAQ
jgi:outer membrane PBP1 activator LpoA protein